MVRKYCHWNPFNHLSATLKEESVGLDVDVSSFWNDEYPSRRFRFQKQCAGAPKNMFCQKIQSICIGVHFLKI